MKAGWTISAVLHAGVLAWGLVSISARPLDKPPTESLPVDIISDSDFSQITKGTKNAPKAEAPKQLVEKVAEPKPPADNPAPKVVDNKPEIAAAAEKPEPPTPEPVKKVEPKPPTPQPAPKPPEPKQAYAKEPEPKIDPIAEAIKKEQKKPDPKPEKKVETPKPEKKVEPPKPQPKFNASQIAALLDKREAQRQSVTGATLSNKSSLGLATANAATLSQNEMDALRARLRDCWTVPVGVAEARDLVVTVRILFNKDGSLAGDPTLMNHGSHPAFQAAAESALRGVRRCAPYSFMPPLKYEAWKDVIVDFDPRDMFRG
jgi:outer membrane biosynthesis protein TonB